MSAKLDIDKIEDAIVDIASRINRRTKQKSYKDFDDVNHIFCETHLKTIDIAKAIHKKGSTKKDIQSKLTEVAVACILGIEFLERDSE